MNVPAHLDRSGQGNRLQDIDARRSVPSPQRARIWALDDSPLQLASVLETLATRYEVEGFEDGSTLLERLAAGHGPDVLVLDWHLPGVTGADVLTFVRQERDETTLPVLVLTASPGGSADVLAALDARANDFVTKPFAAAELLARVATLVRTRTLYARALDAEQERSDALDRERALRGELERSGAETMARQQKLFATFMQAPVAVAILAGPDHVFAFANDAYRAIVGGREVVGRALAVALPEACEQGLEAHIERVRTTGEPAIGKEIPMRFARGPAGGTVFVNFTYTALRDASGAVEGVVACLVDVTVEVEARRRVEALARRLSASEERLRRVVDASRMGTWEMDPATGVLAADAHFRALYGLAGDEAFTLDATVRAVHPDDRERVAHALAEAMAGAHDGVYREEYRVGARWVEARGLATTGADGRIVRFLGTAIDVTERKEGELALASERQTLAAIFDVSPAAMALWRGRDLVFDRVNPEYAAIFAGRRLLGLPIEEALPELTAQGFPSLLRHVFDTGEPHIGHEVLVRLQAVEGGPLEEHFYDYSYVRVNDAEGRPYGVYDHAIDVTDRVLARRRATAAAEAVALSEERLRAVLEATVAGTWELDPARRFFEADESLRAMHGWPATGPLAMPDVYATLEEEDRAMVRGRVDAALRGADEGRYLAEYRARSRDGVLHWIEARGRVTFDADGRAVRFLGTARDVTARKAEELSRARLLDAISSQELVAVALLEGPDLVYRLVNAQYAASVTFGRDVVGRPLAVALPEAMIYAPELRAVLESGIPRVMHETVRHIARPDHTLGERYFNSVWQPVRGATQAVESILVLSHDVTDVVLARRSAERLASQESERLEFEQQLIGIVSHDLKGPLAAIAFSGALLDKATLDTHARRAVSRIRTAVDRAVRMVNDILDFTQARLGTGLPIVRGPVDLHAVVERAAEELRASHPGRVIRVEARGDAQGEWDGDRMQQVVSNLASNALKYGAMTSPVVLRTRGEHDTVLLEVHNDGSPIPDEGRARLFEPLQRATIAGDDSGRSVGLGLYIVRHIVEAHRGSVDVLSTASHGTTFTVRLPRS